MRHEFREFIKKHFDSEEGYELAEDLRAIVVSGDSPLQSFQDIRKIIVNALPGQAGKIKDTINPLYVGAVGAAEWAKRQVQDPKILKDIEVDTMVHDTPGHDEL